MGTCWRRSAPARGQNLGVVSFVAAPMHLGPRDEHVGWDKPTRGRNLHRLMANDRVLIPPGVRVANLASHALGLALQDVAQGLLLQRNATPASETSRLPRLAMRPRPQLALGCTPLSKRVPCGTNGRPRPCAGHGPE